MLKIQVLLSESFDEVNNEFVSENFEMEFEHSLVSLSKWESKFEKPFLTQDEKSAEETLEYLRCMLLTENVPEEVWNGLSETNVQDINEYVNAKQTATWFNEKPDGKPGKETITAELIYYWMVSLQIPFECQYWHLNRLLTLIKVCNIKNQPEKKMSRQEAMQQHRALNAQRRQGGRG